MKTRYGNAITQCQAGHSHASKLESSVCQILYLRRHAGEIKEIQSQDHIYLSAARIGYICDFKCLGSDDVWFWVEAKGYANDRWPIIKKLFKHYGPGKLEIWKGTHLKPVLVETIQPIKE